MNLRKWLGSGNSPEATNANGVPQPAGMSRLTAGLSKGMIESTQLTDRAKSQPASLGCMLIAAARPMASMLYAIATLRVGTIVGVGLVFVTLLAYRSVERRPVLDLWSYELFALLLFLAAFLAVCSARALHRYLRMHEHHESRWTYRHALDVVVLLSGVSHAWRAAARPTTVAHLFDLNLFGSTVPEAAFLQWLALLLAAVALMLWTAQQNRWKRDVGVVAGAVLTTLVFAEGVTRISVLMDPVPKAMGAFSTDAWRMERVELNDLGFRDTKHDLIVDPGVRRLLVIGDSFAYGWGINDLQRRFGEQLAALLTSGTREHWGSINASKPATATPQHIEYLHTMLPYKPDVILLLYVFNDIDYLESAIPDQFRAHQSQPGRLHPQSILFRNSYLFQESLVRLRALYYSHGTLRASFGELGPEYPYAYPDLVARHLKDLTKFVQSARQSGAMVGIVPFEIDVLLGGPHAERYERFILQAHEQGLPIWEVTDSLRGRHWRDLTLNQFDPHPNELANQLAATSVAQYLVR